VLLGLRSFSASTTIAAIARKHSIGMVTIHLVTPATRDTAKRARFIPAVGASDSAHFCPLIPRLVDAKTAA
jgi:hypothetical protein